MILKTLLVALDIVCFSSFFLFANGFVLLKDIKDYNLYGIDLLTPQRKAILPYKYDIGNYI
jgi:hypothetical protein